MIGFCGHCCITLCAKDIIVRKAGKPLSPFRWFGSHPAKGGLLCCDRRDGNPLRASGFRGGPFA
jgi:hypothetical protein